MYVDIMIIVYLSAFINSHDTVDFSIPFSPASCLGTSISWKDIGSVAKHYFSASDCVFSMSQCMRGRVACINYFEYLAALHDCRGNKWLEVKNVSIYERTEAKVRHTMPLIYISYWSDTTDLAVDLQIQTWRFRRLQLVLFDAWLSQEWPLAFR
jgi:hypothetical protein